MELLDMIGTIIDRERRGHWVIAAMALVELRKHYETLALTDLPVDEQTWRGFATKHLPFGPDRADELIGRMVYRGGLLRCTKCGTETKCACTCGAPYFPRSPWVSTRKASAVERAAAALAVHPKKSDRTIAAEIGVDHKTVGKARRSLQNQKAQEPGRASPPDSPRRANR